MKLDIGNSVTLADSKCSDSTNVGPAVTTEGPRGQPCPRACDVQNWAGLFWQIGKEITSLNVLFNCANFVFIVVFKWKKLLGVLVNFI